MAYTPATARHHMQAALMSGLLLTLVNSGFAQSPAPVEPPAWTALSTQQRSALAPLEKDWGKLSALHQRKWLEVANRMPAMPAEQQQRVRERMQEWSRLSPTQRGEARLNFQQAQQWPGAEKQAKWEAYQALPEAQRKALAAKAAPSAPASAPLKALRSASLDAQAPKSNLVKPQTTPTPAPKTVAPSVVQASPGATTNLVSAARPTPPAHQQAGMPKIAVGPGMVDRSTLLPKRGPQAAGALPASGAPMSVAAPAALPVTASAASSSSR